MKESTRLTPFVAKNLFIRKAKLFIRISNNDIRYITVNGKYCHIVCAKEKFLVQIPMKQLIKELAGRDFFRIHRNFIINLNSIKLLNMSENFIELVDGTALPFSREGKRDFSKQFPLLS